MNWLLWGFGLALGIPAVVALGLGLYGWWLSRQELDDDDAIVGDVPRLPE